MTKRVWIVVAAALIVAATAAYALRAPTGVPSGAPTLDGMARSIGTPVMEHIYRGHVPGRSPEIFLVPRPHRYLIGRWDLTTLGTGNLVTTSSHPNPWDYLARVPIVLHGAGVDAGRADTTAVDIADLAPTYAALLGMDGFESDGRPLPGVTPGDPPKVIFTAVIDGGGWNALQEHPESWPNIRWLMDNGVSYESATIGSAPSITGALHATFGTGFYPNEHGIPGNQTRDDEGRNVDAWLQNADPRLLKKPTVSELWDEANDNEAIVGTVSYEGWHLGMIGHGAARPDADQDIAVLWEADDNSWWINEGFYRLPDYLLPTDLATLERYERGLDARDGVVDGLWFGHSLEELQENRVRPGTPAFTRFTGDAVAEILDREGIGADDITDMFWVEFKMPDYAGHAWNVLGPEQADVIAETDAQIGRLRRWLDRNVGRGEYVFAVSADHGQEPFPEMTGGWRIASGELEADIEARFGPVVEKISPVDIYMDMAAVRERDVSLVDIARYIATYTIGDNIPDDAPGAERVPQARLDEPLFAGAFPTGYLQSLTPTKIASFGDSDYPEGNFPVTPIGR